jgi:hypothetical protein
VDGQVEERVKTLMTTVAILFLATSQMFAEGLNAMIRIAIVISARSRNLQTIFDFRAALEV